jgi:hypothetical protein
MLRKGLVITIILLMILITFSGCFGPEEEKETKVSGEGYEGVSWTEVIPERAAMLIQHDSESYLDDYAYLAGVPASVYYDETSEKLISFPLLFYDNPSIGSDQTLTLNAGQGVEYFMEDWMTYSDGELDFLQLVNVPDGNPSTSKWKAKKIEKINSDNYAKVAAEIATINWAYSDTAVVAVAEADYSRPDIETTGELQGRLPAMGAQQGEFTGTAKPAPLSPIFHDFRIEEGYKYIIADMTWGNELNPVAEVTARGKDPDLQLYDWALGPNGAEVACSANWNVISGAREHIGSYVYDDDADWSAAVTYMPTKPAIDFETISNNQDSNQLTIEEKKTLATVDNGPTTSSSTSTSTRGEDSSNIDAKPFGGETDYTITYTLYPGIEIPFNDSTPFMCRDAKFKLEWKESNMNLGLIIRGPSGADIANAIQPSGSNSQEIELSELGQGEYYATVVNLDETAAETEFTIKYSWRQAMDIKEGKGLMSASNGAVLASLKNAPLLYTGIKTVPDATADALDTLGVTKIILVNIGGIAGQDLITKIKSLRSSFQKKIEIDEISHCSDIYERISELSKRDGIYQNDIVFTTINPWTTWYVTEGIADEQAKSIFIGPAAYAAAHHGGPVIIVDMYSSLSSAQSWHNMFWRKAYPGRLPPSVGCMMLTGLAVYDWLDDYGLDRPGMESILTVAGQFDIGTAWDRMLVGAAVSGRIMGSPVDTAYWISRSVLYPAIIYANPAVNPELDKMDGMRITGSESVRLGNGVLRITKPEQEIKTEYNVLQTWVSYQHRFNERASKYWGCDYVTATGITPYRTPTFDEGVNDLYGVWPDLTDTEIVPHYLDQLGYDSVFTTNFDKTMENMNRGTIMWLEVMHGGNSNGGVVGFWKEGQLEDNPWRGYEENALTLRGSTADPDVVSMNRNIGLDIQPGISPKTQLEILPETHDGVIIALAQQEQTNYKVGTDFDDALENVHSMGVSAGSCLIANTYLHLSLIRHGGVFQIIDPWLTSWYSAFAMETFARDLILGYSVGEAYERGIAHVGVQYLTEGWWWDIFENLVYFGDPDLRVFIPNEPWEEPAPLITDEKTATINGHAPFGATEHPNAIEDMTGAEMGFYSSLVIIMIIIGIVAFRRWKKSKVNSKTKHSGDTEASD